MKERFTLFWNGPFSQWADSPFVFENVNFNRAEQFMMFCKAVIFEDYLTAYRIMQASHPSKQKKLGRQVRNFDLGTWKKVARDVVYTGSYMKYTQNSASCKKLFETEDTTLVEASPYDRVWGIGLAEYDPKCLNRETWDGKNWLGETLTRLRSDLLNNTKDCGAIRLCEQLLGKYKNYWRNKPLPAPDDPEVNSVDEQ